MPNLRKTKLCPRYAQGRCAAGGECKYAHGEVELRATVDFYKTSLCSEWSSGGQCVRGDSCRYAHGPHELRAPGGFHAPGRSVTSPPHSEPAGIAASNRHALAPTNIFKSPLPLPLAQLTVTADPVAAGMPPPGYFARPGLPPYLDYAITCDIPLGGIPAPVLCPEGPPDTQSLQMADGNGVLAGGSLHQELSQEPTERHLITYEQPFLGNDNGRATTRIAAAAGAIGASRMAPVGRAVGNRNAMEVNDARDPLCPWHVLPLTHVQMSAEKALQDDNTTDEGDSHSDTSSSVAHLSRPSTLATVAVGLGPQLIQQSVN